MSARAASIPSLNDMLVVEDDSDILKFQCAHTGLLLWPQIRVAFFRMMMSDLLYGVQLTGKTSAKIPAIRAMGTLVRSLTHNFRRQRAGENRASICLMGDGVANQWIAGRWFNRLTDHFVSISPHDTLVVEDHFEWRWPFPRNNNRVMFHAPLQAINAIEGRLRVRAHHRQQARRLMNLVSMRARQFLRWEPGQERHEWMVEILARKAASMPSQYAAYLAMLDRIHPRVLLVGAACYGPSSSLIAAARSQGIVTAEYQHGAISAGHDAYNFAPLIRDSEEYRQTLPEYFLGYGKWGNDQINAPVKKLAIGSPHRAMRLAETAQDALKKNDLLVLSDGLEFDLYLKLARQLAAAAHKRGLRVVLRPHPLERTHVASLSRTQLSGIVIDANPDLYTSLSTAQAIVGEVSTGLFEAVGIVDKIFIWDTPKAKFAYPSHPFRTFESASMLMDLLGRGDSGRLDQDHIDAIWAGGWQTRYESFLKSCGVSRSVRIDSHAG